MNGALVRLASKFAALALLALVIAAVWFTAIVPVTEHLSALRDQIETQRTLLGRLETARGGDGAGKVRIRIAALERERLFVAGESDAVQTAALQGLVGKLAADAGLRLQSVEPQAVRGDRGLKWIGLGVRFTARIEELQRLVAAMEASRPVLVVANLAMVPAIEADGRFADRLAVTLSVLAAAADAASAHLKGERR